MGTRMNPLITASPHEISLLRNEIVRLNAAIKKCTDPEQRHILYVRRDAKFGHLQELTRPPSLPEQVG